LPASYQGGIGFAELDKDTPAQMNNNLIGGLDNEAFGSGNFGSNTRLGLDGVRGLVGRDLKSGHYPAGYGGKG
jgi:hypothetical protein